MRSCPTKGAVDGLKSMRPLEERFGWVQVIAQDLGADFILPIAREKGVTELFYELSERQRRKTGTIRGDPIMHKRVLEAGKYTDYFLVIGNSSFCVGKESFTVLFEFNEISRSEFTGGNSGRVVDGRMFDRG